MEYDTGTDPKIADSDDDENTRADTFKLAQKWSTEISAAKRWRERFQKAARECERQYLNAGPNSGTSIQDFGGKVNLFWSNVQVILSAIYGRLPAAEVDRRFNDFQDDVSRVAAIIMQRILNGDIRRQYDDTNAAMRDAVQDRFVSGLGQVWVRYEVQTEMQEQPVIDPMTGLPQMGEDGFPVTQQTEVILNEDAEVDYVYWDDFLYSPCRRWRDNRWAARRVYMSREALEKRFKLEDGQIGMIPFQARMPSDREGNSQDDVLRATPFQQAAVWEIWCKDGNYVCWYVEGCNFVLDQVDDPLELDDFFPCPEPITATTLTKAFLPRPDYAMCQDLYRELDKVNARLSHLTDAVKAAGVYDKTAAPVKSLLTTSVQNALVPVDNWSAFSDKNGLRGVVDWMPIEQFVNAIVQLNQRKQQLQADLYEVLGISDIMRGASVASETATAQQLKAQFGGARLNNLQNEVARFVAGVMRIRANVIANIFQPDTIKRRSLIDRTPDAQYADQAIALLKQWGLSTFSVEVTSDSLAAPDWAAEKEARTEFLGAASNFIMSAAPLMQQDAGMGPFLVKLLQWASAGFKGAKTIEGVLDQAAAQLEQKAAQPPAPPQPTPEDKKNEATAQKELALAGKYGAETQRTVKEAALLPPLGQTGQLHPPPQAQLPVPGEPGMNNMHPLQNAPQAPGAPMGMGGPQ